MFLEFCTKALTTIKMLLLCITLNLPSIKQYKLSSDLLNCKLQVFKG